MLNWLKSFFKPKPTVVPAPMQWTIFALRNIDEAKPIASPKVPSLTTVASINTRVNSGIKPKTERSDVWSLWPKEGDCDDYSVTKRHELRKLSTPSCLAVVKTSAGVGHCVLIVQTTSGEYVLDNLHSSPVTRKQCGHAFIIEQTTNPSIWINSRG